MSESYKEISGVLMVLFGPPGSGKGTQAELLKSRLGFVHYSTGEVFREQISQQTALGQQVASYVTKGALVPDEIVLAVVEDFVLRSQGSSIVFDGFPRTVPQAVGLDGLLKMLGKSLRLAVLIDLDEGEVVRRLSSRRQCRVCGKIYNLSFSPPRRDGVCDECGGELYQRDDDRVETIRSRLLVYNKQTRPLIEYYERNNKLVRIDGALGRDRVFEELVRLIRS